MSGRTPSQAETVNYQRPLEALLLFLSLAHAATDRKEAPRV